MVSAVTMTFHINIPQCQFAKPYCHFHRGGQMITMVELVLVSDEVFQEFE